MAAGHDLDVDVLWNGPATETDYSRQIEIVDSMIARHVDGIALAAQDRTDDARAALREAFDLYGLKGNLVSADRALAIEGEFRVSAA